MNENSINYIIKIVRENEQLKIIAMQGEKLRAENERLREALAKITMHTDEAVIHSFVEEALDENN